MTNGNGSEDKPKAGSNTKDSNLPVDNQVTRGRDHYRTNGYRPDPIVEIYCHEGTGP